MKDIMLKITGKTVRQDEGSEKHEDIMEFVTAGQLYHRGTTTFIKYPESELSGLEGCTTSLIITKFESVLDVSIVFSAAIPMLMDTGGNCGGQASVTIIRALSLEDVEFRDLFRVVW